MNKLAPQATMGMFYLQQKPRLNYNRGFVYEVLFYCDLLSVLFSFALGIMIFPFELSASSINRDASRVIGMPSALALT